MRALAMNVVPKLKLPERPGKPGSLFDLAPLFRNAIHKLTLWTYKPKYLGFEHIPAEGPAILVCNHVSYVDGPIIDAGCNRPIRYLIDEEIYNLPVVNYMMRLNHSIPISYNRKSVEKAFDDISATLKAGELVCIFPEGFLTYTGGLGRFRPGIEAICQRDPVPVIPIALSGLWGSIFSRKYLHSRLRFWPRELRREVIAICGEPIPADQVTVNYLQEVILKLKYSIGD